MVNADLVKAVQRNERGAMDELIRATYQDVYRLARRLLNNDEDAKDATQEVFIRVVRNVLAYRGEAAFATWLHTITVNVCLTQIKRKLTLDVTDFDLESSDNVERDFDNKDLKAKMAWALDQLPDDARTVVVLRDVQELSTKEVARMLDVSESVVKVRLHRAHLKLRELIGEDE